MVLSERGGGLGVIFGGDYPSLHAKTMGKDSGFPFTEQRQLEMYRESEGQESDQIVYAEVLRKTGKPVDAFEAKYPHIFNRTLTLNLPALTRGKKGSV
jgi:hypothetical protein